MKGYVLRITVMFCLLFTFTGIGLFSGRVLPYGSFKEVPYGIGQWDAAKYGNHRAVVRVTYDADAAAVDIPWRRRDPEPEKKNIVVVDAKTGKRILNVYRLAVNRYFGSIIFQPQSGPGDYYVYYMPYVQEGRTNYPTVVYPEPEETADKKWLTRNMLSSSQRVAMSWPHLPRSQCLEIQSIDKFNSFYPMEVVAAPMEINKLISRNRGKSYLLFPEDRANPIRMTADLPYKWVKSGALSTFEGSAARGEFYAFQMGVYPVAKDIESIKADFTDLKSTGGNAAIPASALRCFNLGGVNWNGENITKLCPVKKGNVQALWFGVQVPRDLRPGTYEGQVTVTPKNMEPQSVTLRLTVTNEVLEDAGDSEPWRHSRLRWLDSRIAFDNEITPPFTPMEVDGLKIGRMLSCLGRTVIIGKFGFPVSIRSRFAPEMTRIVEGSGREVLAAPIAMIVEDARNRVLPWKAGGVTITQHAPGLVAWTFKNTAADGALEMSCRAKMEFDGFVRYEIILSSSRSLPVNDIRLEIPMNDDVAKYMMGLGLKGGFRPKTHKWKWDVKKNQDSAWIGDVNAGMQFSLRGANYSRPLNTNFYHSKPLNMPEAWFNNGSGGIDIAPHPKKKNTLLVNCTSGKRSLEPGQTLHFYFNLLLTPFKPINTASQWHHRFYHRFEPLEKIMSTGANTINVHHATEINPFINYPFLRPKEIKAYIDAAHEKGVKVKIYNTIRELSNIAPEIFALRSLGSEVISEGPGGGFAWLQEHIGSNYIAGWYVPRYKDAAIINSGMSRWHNYYLEGIHWLVKNVGIDGLYIDDLAFDRTTMKRLRKILDRGREGAMIDLHSANQYNTRDGFTNSANLYLEHFPYINRLWFGEYFDYNSAPDFWMVEVSGIPFGLMGEMLQDGGNPWRGMVYGMTNRLPWAGDPSPLWKAWDEFGIKKSAMMGYWSPNCPVETGHKDVLATAYVIEGQRTLVALAGWAKEPVKCKLSIHWKTLGLDPAKVKLTAPAIKDFQSAAAFKPGDPIPIEPGKGWLLVIE